MASQTLVIHSEVSLKEKKKAAILMTQLIAVCHDGQKAELSDQPRSRSSVAF